MHLNNKKYDKYKDSGVKWIGEIPYCWKLVKTGRIFRNTKEIVGKKSISTQRLALTLNGVIKRDINDAEGLQPEQFDSYQYLRKNQLVFKLIDLENVNTSRVGLCPFEEGMVSPAYIVLHNNSNDNRYYHYYFLSLWHNEIFNHLGGDGVRSALNAKDLLSIPTFVLSIEEQQAIADYLDKKCGDIDNTIEMEKSIIEKLKEYKQSVITETVTKGLDKSVELKDSGIEWIGKIPKHWEIVRLKNVTDIIMGQSPNSEIKDYGETLFMQGNADFNNTYPTPTLYCDNASKKSRINDILMSVRAPVGEINISDKIYGIGRGLCSIKALNIFQKYLWFYILKSKDIFSYYSNGSTFDAITVYDLRNFQISLPPKKEQQQIANYLDKKCSQIDETIEKKEQLIEKLTEYKKSLIYECVTGKRKVC